jgi:hypothetical protein
VPTPYVPPVVPQLRAIPASERWIRFRDPRVPISFEHPENWLVRVSRDLDQNPTLVTIENFQPGRGRFTSDLIKIEIVLQRGALATQSFAEYLARPERALQLPFVDLEPQQSMTVGGRPAVRTVRTGIEAPLGILLVTVAMEPDVYNIVAPAHSELRAEFDRIVASTEFGQ